jgi:hypothetical protein
MASKLALISFDEAKEHLQIDHDLDDNWVDRNRKRASGIILDYLKIRNDTLTDRSNFDSAWRASLGGWWRWDDARWDTVDESTVPTFVAIWFDRLGEPTISVPAPVEQATLLVLGAMYENRDGDVWRMPQTISQSIIDLLMRSRDPALA